MRRLITAARRDPLNVALVVFMVFVCFGGFALSMHALGKPTHVECWTCA